MVVVVFVVVVVVGPIWAQVCPCLGPRLLLLWLSLSSLFFVVVVVGRCWPDLGAGLPLSWP